jgi:putative colanic acid biosynthesis UDP-glucose lipid carrier transferase
MTTIQRGRYSKYLKYITVSIDIFGLFVLSYLVLDKLNINLKIFFPYLFFGWLSSTLFIGFYNVYRFTTPVEIISKILKQFALFSLFVIAYFPFAKTSQFDIKTIALFLGLTLVFITIVKASLFFLFKFYRIKTGNNFRKTVIIGETKEAVDLENFFKNRLDLGYKIDTFFKELDVEKHDYFSFIKHYLTDNNIDVVFCSLRSFSEATIKDLIYFCDLKNISLKFLPDNTQLFTKNIQIDYYETTPILSIQVTRLHHPVVKTIKRLFDILFSLFVVVFILSWLTLLLAILIYLESKGPIFFKQGRPGINETEFDCYKFRSMKVNNVTEKEASRNDPRVTKIGRFMRKTSIDELPQFFNVLLGDMSIVGPRPHLWSQNKTYSNKIKKYMNRHYVKPGITGLAQVKGYRGEIETDEDMIFRIKYDIFYIENWSLSLDIKIIFLTVFNIFKGEKKAY